MSNKTYMVEYVTWNDDDEDWEDEKECWDLTGIEAMAKIAEFLVKYPNAREASIATEPEDGMFLSIVFEDKENRREYWLDAYCRDKERVI